MAFVGGGGGGGVCASASVAPPEHLLNLNIRVKKDLEKENNWMAFQKIKKWINDHKWGFEVAKVQRNNKQTPTCQKLNQVLSLLRPGIFKFHGIFF